MSSKNFMSYDDAATVLGAYAEAIKSKQSLTAGDYIGISSGTIKVNLEKGQPDVYSYKFVTTSTSDHTPSVKIQKYLNGTLVSEQNYVNDDVRTPITVDDRFTFTYGDGGWGWKYTLLQASNEHIVGYSLYWNYNQTVEYEETFDVYDQSTKLATQGYVDTAMATKQDTLTFDDVPTANSNNPVKSSGVKSAIDAAVASAYHHAGTKTCAELVAGLLVAGNEGNVYNMTDSGTTTSDFIEGQGQPIKAGDNVGIAKISDGVYKFDLLSGFVDTTNFVQKSQTSGLLKNDGTVNDEIEGDVSTLKSGFTNLDTEVNGDATTYPYADVITIPDAIPANLADCSVKIEPVQSGSGDPSPTNIRPITGHTEASVLRDGFNIWNGNATDGKAIANNGGTYNSENNFVTRYVRVYPGVKYYVNRQNWESWIGVYDSEKQHTVGENVRIDTSDNSIVFAENVFYARFTGKLATKQSACLNVFNESLNGTYKPYQGKTYTIALGDTVYGGTVDFKTGVMMVTHKVVDLGDYSWTKNNSNFYTDGITDFAKDTTGSTQYATYCISDRYPVRAQGGTTQIQLYYNTAYSGYRCFVFDDPAVVDMNATQFKIYITGTHICYELATPTTIQLTPTQIQLLKGTNTLTASTGQISVTVNGVSGAIGSVQEQVNDIAGDKQDKTDNSLNTTSKTVVGSINELDNDLANVANQIVGVKAGLLSSGTGDTVYIPAKVYPRVLIVLNNQGSDGINGRPAIVGILNMGISGTYKFEQITNITDYALSFTYDDTTDPNNPRFAVQYIKVSDSTPHTYLRGFYLTADLRWRI